MRRFLTDPLLHFLVAGALVFAGFQLVDVAEEEPRDDTITVTRTALLEFIQYRSKQFNPEIAADRLDRMGPDQRADLIDEFVREEALYREAVALGLDANDYVIKQRVIQTLEFAAGGVSEADAAPDDAEIAAFLEANLERYQTPPAATFAHVFVSSDGRSAEAAEAEAEAILNRLQAESAPFTAAPGFGDRFLYHVNYVEREQETVAAHFGGGFADALFALTPQDGLWQGPIRSAYGLHLVMLRDKSDARTPPLDEIRARVLTDMQGQTIADRRRAALDAIVSRYRVDIDLDPSPRVNAAEN